MNTRLKFLLVLVLGTLIAGPVIADYVYRDGNNALKTMKAFNCLGATCQQSTPTDQTGAAFGVPGNPFYVLFPQTPSVYVIPQAASARNFPGCTVGTSSDSCLSASSTIVFLQVQNTSASATIACAFGVTAVLNDPSSFQLAPGQAASWGANTGGVPSSTLNCIASAASTPMYLEWN